MLKLCHTLNSIEPLAGDEKITKDPTGGRERRPWGVWERRVALAVLLLSSHAAAFLIGAAVGGRKVSSSTDSPLTRRYSSGPYNSSTPWLRIKRCMSAAASLPPRAEKRSNSSRGSLEEAAAISGFRRRGGWPASSTK